MFRPNNAHTAQHLDVLLMDKKWSKSAMQIQINHLNSWDYTLMKVSHSPVAGWGFTVEVCFMVYTAFYD